MAIAFPPSNNAQLPAVLHTKFKNKIKNCHPPRSQHGKVSVDALLPLVVLFFLLNIFSALLKQLSLNICLTLCIFKENHNYIVSYRLAAVCHADTTVCATCMHSNGSRYYNCFILLSLEILFDAERANMQAILICLNLNSLTKLIRERWNIVCIRAGLTTSCSA